MKTHITTKSSLEKVVRYELGLSVESAQYESETLTEMMDFYCATRLFFKYEISVDELKNKSHVLQIDEYHEMERWLKENNIVYFRYLQSDLISNSKTGMYEFTCEEDVMAFKLRWQE